MAGDEDKLADALFGPVEEAAAPPPAEAPLEPAQPEPEQPAQQAPQPEQPPAETKPEHFVPLPKYLDTRDELKEAKRKLAEYEARQQQAPQEIPDPIDDLAGYEAYQNAKLTAFKFEMSDEMATQAHGKDAVEAAKQWALERAQAEPSFADQYHRQRHPIDWIVRQHKRDALVSQLPTDVSSLDELIEREIAKRTQNAGPPTASTAGMAQPVSAQPAAPPKSLVDAPSGGGVTTVPVGPTAGFDAVFTR